MSNTVQTARRAYAKPVARAIEDGYWQERFVPMSSETDDFFSPPVKLEFNRSMRDLSEQINYI